MGVALVALAASGPWICDVHAGGKERGRPIEFSEPRSDEVTTNLHQLTSKKDSLKQLEEDLYKSVRTFSGRGSLDGVPAPLVRPPAGPVIPSKRVKELLERHKNAPFLTLEDLFPTPTVEEILKVPEYGPDGLEKKKKTPIEQYYDRLDTKSAADRTPRLSQEDQSIGSPNVLRGRDVPAPRDDVALPPGLREREQALKKLFEAESSDAAVAPNPARRNSFSDIFGLGENAPSREKALEHKKLMAEFNSILESSRLPAAGADAPNLPSSSPEPWGRAANPFAVSDTAPTGNSQLGSINPLFTPSSPPDVNAQALGQSKLTPLLPKAEVPKPPSAPTFIAPRRPF
jgi:hypothetical protein